MTSEYMTSEYPAGSGHGMLLVQLHGPGRGRPWAPAAARGMLRRAGNRAGVGRVRPHAFRHSFASALAHGAGLHYIRRYLGHVSTRMTEHYANSRELHQPGEKRQVSSS